MPEARKKMRLGELMVQQGLISQDQLRIALMEQEQDHNNIPLGRQLVRLGFVTEAMVRDLVAHTIGQESVDLDSVIADVEALKLVPEEFARRHHLLPIAFDETLKSLVVAMADMFNVVALDQLRAMLGGQIQIKPVLAGEAQLEEHIDQFYGYELSVDGILREIETGEIDYGSLQTTAGEEYTQPVVRLVGALLMDAVKRGASDIHFEPEHAFLRIRYRIDGVLQQSTPLSDNNNIAFISELFAYLARGGYTADPVWMGEILEFNIFNKALSPEEVLFLFNKGATTTSVEDGLTMLPKEYNLLQNYPNPFNPGTKISFDLPKESMVKISGIISKTNN